MIKAELLEDLGAQIQHPFTKADENELQNLTGSSVSFPWQSESYLNGVIKIQIDCIFEIGNNEKVLSSLTMRSFYKVRNIADDEESRAVLEQILYRAYDYMFKAHKIRYSDSVIRNREVCLPLTLRANIEEMISKFIE